MLAAQSGRADTIQLLLEHSPSEQLAAADTTYGYTALMLAAKHGHAEVIRLLCEHSPGADFIAASQDNGSTALSLAARYGHTECTELLLAHGAELKAPQLRVLDCFLRDAIDTYLPGEAHDAMLEYLRLIAPSQ